MGNCVYKMTINEQVQQEKYVDNKFNEDKEQIKAAFSITDQNKNTQTLKISQFQSTVEKDSGVSQLLNSSITNQPKLQQNLTVSSDLLVRKFGQDEKFTAHYDIIKKLGEGGFGQVYLVNHKKTNIQRAVKVLLRDKLEDEKLLIQETEVLQTLDHPNIMKALEIFRDEKYFYIITEYLQGGELLDRVRTMTNFNEQVVKLYMKQIISAMVYCHERKIVHRDLKPENILFDNHSVDSNLRIIDFGASEKLMSKKLTEKIGTPYYLAPEIITSQGYDEKVDVWSCGIVMYVLFVGKAPFRGKNLIETLQQAQLKELEFYGPNWRKISKDAIDLLKLMTQKDPQKRISMKEAMSHKWIVNPLENPIAFEESFINNISSFKGYNKLRVAIYQFVTIQISQKEDQEKCLNMFKKLDKNGDGVLSEDEIINGMILANVDQISAKLIVTEVIQQIDANQSGKIDFTEFVTASIILQKKLLKEKITAAFKLFDLDEDGRISKQEIQQVFGGIEIEHEAWQDILKQCDQNKDGYIEPEEFVSLLENLQ